MLISSSRLDVSFCWYLHVWWNSCLHDWVTFIFGEFFDPVWFVGCIGFGSSWSLQLWSPNNFNCNQWLWEQFTGSERLLLSAELSGGAIVAAQEAMVHREVGKSAYLGGSGKHNATHMQNMRIMCQFLQTIFRGSEVRGSLGRCGMVPMIEGAGLLCGTECIYQVSSSNMELETL